MYINYAKHRAKPTLTPAAAEHIASAYRDLRQDLDSTKTLPITARCLETLIRLATAHAKCRLDKTSVTVEDAEVAVTVLKFALFNQAEPDKSEKVFKRRARKARGAKGDPAPGDDTDDDSESDGDDVHATPGATASTAPSATPTRKSARKAGATGSSGSALAFPESMEAEGPELDEESTPKAKAKSKAKTSTPKSSSKIPRGTAASQHAQDSAPGSEDVSAAVDAGDMEEIVQRIKAALNALRGREDVIPVSSILEWLGKEENSQGKGTLTEAQVRAGLEKLQADDIIVMSDDTVFIV